MYELGGSLAGTEVAPGNSLLITGPALSGKDRLGFEFLEHGLANGEGAIIVTNRDSADRLRRDHEVLFEAGPPVGIVDCITKHQGQGTIRDSDDIRYASSPEDMTGIGIKFSNLLEGFYKERGVTKNRVLFTSLSTLLIYSDLQTVFRFLHVFTSRIENADALGLFVLESEAHDSQAMNTLSQLFDGLIRIEEDGGIETRLP
ncbi:RAD55 family ATPase [Natronomonas sp. EA1]|uniref:RAD55 family ATPase n=1 Tax=Natronomonas sp. EA1 TaxID=3421655 RepID=UPI003EBBA192